MEKASVFEKTIKDYLQQITCLKNKEEIARVLGCSFTDGEFRMPFFKRDYIITADDIVDANGKSAAYSVSVILCKYLLLCPRVPLEDASLVTYKDFKDAAPLVGNFRTAVEQPIAAHFTQKKDGLARKCLELGATQFATDVSCDLAMRFQALPKVPLFVLFNDADEDFPAQITLLFQRDLASYLDMECVAMVGSALARYLTG